MKGGPDSVKKALEDAVCDAVAGKEVTVAFSGGLDSGVIAAMVKKYAREATLLTAGSKDSRDAREAERSAAELGISGRYAEINENNVRDAIRDIISITGMKDPVTISFEIPLYFVCMHSETKEILTGQGADELFAGYSKYVGIEENDLKKMREDDLKKVIGATVPYEKMIAGNFDKKISHPYLDPRVIGAVTDLGIKEIIPAGEPLSRKRVLREVAVSMGYEGIPAKEKKAAQYSSGTMTLIKKICKSKDMTFTELIGSIGGDVQ